MELLGPYLPAIFDELPALLPHLGPLLDELTTLAPHLPVLLAHRTALLPALPHLAPHLHALQPYIDVLAKNADFLAPYASCIAPHLSALLPHMPVLIARLNDLIPHLPLLAHEEALSVLLPHLSLLLGSDTSLLRTQALRLLGVSGVVDKSSEALHKSTEALNGSAVDESQPTVNFWTMLKRRLIPFAEEVTTSPSAEEASEQAAAKAVELLARLSDVLNASEQRTANLEGEFRRFKEQMGWQHHQHADAAMRLCAVEGEMMEAEDSFMEMVASSRRLDADAETYARRIGTEAIERGRARVVISNKASSAAKAAKTDSFLWRLPL